MLLGWVVDARQSGVLIGPAHCLAVLERLDARGMELSSFWSRGFWDIAYLEDKELVNAILNGGPVLLHQLEV